MPALTRQQLVLLIPLTLLWGLNWPVMKLGLSDFPPLTFRAMSLWLGVPVLAAVLWVRKVPFHVPRADWGALFWLAATNMFVWHAAMIVALKALSGGRAAILGYTMPVFSALIGAWLFSNVLSRRAWFGVAATGIGVALLLWHELTGLSGQPGYVALALFAAATWALGTQMLRHTRVALPTLTLAFWMTTLTAFVVSGLSFWLEPYPWRTPEPTTWAAIAYNGLLIFGFAQTAWLSLARNLPPVASTLSVMLIPVLGVLGGALWLGETVHWQDGVAVVLLLVSIAAVLGPTRAPAPAKLL